MVFMFIFAFLIVELSLALSFPVEDNVKPQVVRPEISKILNNGRSDDMNLSSVSQTPQKPSEGKTHIVKKYLSSRSFRDISQKGTDDVSTEQVSSYEAKGAGNDTDFRISMFDLNGSERPLSNLYTPSIYNFDRCTNLLQCYSYRCVEKRNGFELPCDLGYCYCKSQNPACQSDINCLSGEFCAQIEGSTSICVSKALSNGIQLTMDRCSDIRDCKPPRKCVSTTTGNRCFAHQPCIGDLQCVPGESCPTLHGSAAYCTSNAYLNGPGLSGEHCFYNTDCKNPRLCATFALEPCEGREQCFCFNPFRELAECSNDDDCTYGESCRRGACTSDSV